MTEIRARIMPCPTPQEHLADKEGSPTVSGDFLRRPCRRSQYSNGSAPSVDGEFCAVNETGTIRRQKDNGLSSFVRCTGRPALHVCTVCNSVG